MWIIIDNCIACQQKKPFRPVVAKVLIKAPYPMEQVSLDMFHCKGKDYFVCVDRYSNYPIVKYLKRTSTSDVTSKLLKIFQTFGFPVRIRTDGGPHFRFDTKGKIISIRPTGKSFEVECVDGRKILRNRRYLRKVIETNL